MRPLILRLGQPAAAERGPSQHRHVILDRMIQYTVDERIDMLTEVTKEYPNVRIMSFRGLLVDFCREHGAQVVVKGVRVVGDFEYELQMALMNRRLRPEIETVFLMAGEAHSFISSRLVKEVIRLGGNIGGLVPPSIEVRLKRRLLEETVEE